MLFKSITFQYNTVVVLRISDANVLILLISEVLSKPGQTRDYFNMKYKVLYALGDKHYQVASLNRVIILGEGIKNPS